MTMEKLNKHTKHLLESIDKDIRIDKNADGPFSSAKAIKYLDLVSTADKAFDSWNNEEDVIYDEPHAH